MITTALKTFSKVSVSNDFVLKVCIVGLALGSLAGCAPVEMVPAGRAAEFVTKTKTPFYSFGPAQPKPTEILEKNTFVVLERKEGDFCYGKLDDGRSGYFITADLRPAPPTVPAVSSEELFPPTVELNIPEPDFSQPVEVVPTTAVPTAAR